jgi:hypothetical protein
MNASAAACLAANPTVRSRILLTDAKSAQTGGALTIPASTAPKSKCDATNSAMTAEMLVVLNTLLLMRREKR